MLLKEKLRKIIKETKAQAETNTLYLIIIFAIVAIILLVVVKPMFNNSTKIAAKKANLPNQTVTPPPQ